MAVNDRRSLAEEAALGIMVLEKGEDPGIQGKRIPQYLVSKVAAAVLDARATLSTMKSARNRSYTEILRLIMENDELLAHLYTGTPERNTRYYLVGKAAERLIDELR